MSVRGHIVERYEVDYGDNIIGFNNDMYGFSDELDKLGILHSIAEESCEIEVEINSLMQVDCLEILNNQLRENIEALQKTASRAKYAKNSGFVMLKWF